MEPVEKKHSFIELRAQGISLAAIAKKLSVSKTTLITWGKELKLDIDNARQLEKDALIEKYKAAYHYRLESLLKMYSKLNMELENRDLSDLPTAKLLEQIQQIYYLIMTCPHGLYHFLKDHFKPLFDLVSGQNCYRSRRSII